MQAEELGVSSKYEDLQQVFTSADIIRHYENMPQLYHLLLLPHLTQSVTISEHTSVVHVEELLMNLWPTPKRPETLWIRRQQDLATADYTELQRDLEVLQQ